MTTYSFQGLGLVQNPATQEFVWAGPVGLALNVADTITTASYSIAAAQPGWLPAVDLALDYRAATLNGTLVDLSAPGYVLGAGAIDWSGNTTHVLSVTDQATSMTMILRIGGAALPTFASVAEVNSFFATQVTGLGPSAGGSGFGPGEAVSLAAVPGVAISDGDIVDDSDAGHLIDVGPGDDVVFGNGGDDVIIGGPGNDTLNGGSGMDTASFAGAASGAVANLSAGTANDGDGGTDTLTGIEALTGSDFGDRLVGNSADNRLTGGLGDDVLDGGTGQDVAWYGDATGAVTVDLAYGTASGAAGNDTLTRIEVVVGSNYADTLLGNAGANWFLPDAEDAVGTPHQSLGGADRIFGRGGVDGVSYENAQAGVVVNLSTGTAIDGHGNTDTLAGIEDIRGSDFDDSLTGDDSDNSFWGGAGDNTIFGGDGTDSVVFAGLRASYTISQTGAITHVSDGSHTDTLALIEQLVFDDQTVVLAALSTVLGTEGTDSLSGTAANDHIRALGGGDSLNGDVGDDALDGGAGDDVINGQGGADLLIGGAGADSLFGSSGDDWLIGGAGDDVLNGGSGADRIDGGGGTDQASYKFSSSAVQVDLGAGTAAGGTATGDTLAAIEDVKGSAHADTLTGDAGANRLYGLAGNDVLSGAGGADWLIGDAGDDTLFGGDGDDRLDGGVGADILVGGSGQDQASYANSSAGVSVNLATGLGAGGEAAGDTLSGIENVVGSSQADTITGDGADNRIYSLGGDDNISGGGGTDRIKSGAGDDTLFGNDGDDWFDGGAGADAFDGGAGADMVSYHGGAVGVSVNLATGATAGGEAVGDSFVSVENLGGTDAGDTLTGNAGDNRLYGLGGNDTLAGGGGVDRIRAGAGDDTIKGGDGNDWISGGAGADTIDGGAGTDMAVYEASAAAVTINLAAASASGGDAAGDTLTGIENLMGSAHDDSLTGGGGPNRLIGAAGADVLVGGGGADKLLGGSGDDTFSGGDGDDYMVGGAGGDSFDGGAGSDQVSYASETAAVMVDLGLGTAAGAAAGDTFVFVEDLYGSAYDDTLTGDLASNRLNGGAGDDTLNGGGGVDRIYGGTGDDMIAGGTGNDWVVGGSGADTFVFVSGWGNDTIADFEDGIDLIDLSGAGLTYEDLTITQVGDDVVIDDGAGNTISLTSQLFGNIDGFDFT